MVAYKDVYLRFIAQAGVGSRDRVADSQKSYAGYLEQVSDILGSDVTPKLLGSEDDVAHVMSLLKGKRADKTLGNYQSAMRQYVAMVRAEGLASSASDA